MRMMITSDSGEKSTMSIILIVIGIVCAVMLIGTVVFTGITFLWASSFTDEGGGTVLTLRLDGDIDATEDQLELTVLSGSVNWSEHTVKIDGMTMSTVSMGTYAGDTAIFTASGWDPEPGMTYDVMIIDIDDDQTVWEHSITAKP